MHRSNRPLELRLIFQPMFRTGLQHRLFYFDPVCFAKKKSVYFAFSFLCLQTAPLWLPHLWLDVFPLTPFSHLFFSFLWLARGFCLQHWHVATDELVSEPNEPPFESSASATTSSKQCVLDCLSPVCYTIPSSYH